MFKNAAERFMAKTDAPPKVVQDLDAIIQESTAVKLHGKVHEIKPVLVQEFFILANALAAIKQMEASDKVTLDQIVDGYYGIISAVAPTITKEDIRQCSQSQISALLQHVLEHVNGKITDEKKKTLTKMSIPTGLSN